MKRLWAFLLCLTLLNHVPLSLAEGVETVSEAEPTLESVEAESMPEEIGADDLLLEANDNGDAASKGNDGFAVPKSIELGVKEQFTIDAPGATFKTSKKSVATVSKTGIVTGKKRGTADISVYVDGELVAGCQVKVLAAPNKVTLSKKKLMMTPSGAERLTVKLPKKTASRITWSSSAPSVATVDDDGVVFAVSEGTTNITASTFNGRRATCAVTVVSPGTPVSVSFGIKTVSIGVNESVLVVPTVNEGAKARFKWSTKSKKIATVSQDGVITGKRTGDTKIIVTTQNGLKATLTVKVRKAPSKVTISPKAAKVAVGTTTRLTAKLPKNTASLITWESSDIRVATVFADGTVLGCSPGSATITGWTFNGKKASCVVTVTGDASGDKALREKLVANWGTWKVTEVVTGGIHATTCTDFFTLNLREDSTGGFMVEKGLVTYTHDCHWTVSDGLLVVMDDENGDVILLKPDAQVKRLYLESEGATFIFTQGVDPAPYYYPKPDTVPEDVNGKWVADKVSLATLGLMFKAEDIGYRATLEIQDDTVRLCFPDGEKTRKYTMKVWYPGDGLYPLESEDRDIVYCYTYIPELENMRCTIQTETQDNVTVYFRRYKG